MVSIPIDIWTTAYTDLLRVQRILVTRDPVWIGVTMDVSSTRTYLMLDHIWIFISGYGEQYMRCPSFNWSLPVGLDRRILYGSHRTLSIMAIMAPDNGVFRFSTLRTGMRSFAYGWSSHHWSSIMKRWQPWCSDMNHVGIISSGCLSDIASMTAIWRRLVDTYPSCWALYHVIICTRTCLQILRMDRLFGGYCCHSPNVSFITL